MYSYIPGSQLGTTTKMITYHNAELGRNHRGSQLNNDGNGSLDIGDRQSGHGGHYNSITRYHQTIKLDYFAYWVFRNCRLSELLHLFMVAQYHWYCINTLILYNLKIKHVMHAWNPTMGNDVLCQYTPFIITFHLKRLVYHTLLISTTDRLIITVIVLIIIMIIMIIIIITTTTIIIIRYVDGTPTSEVTLVTIWYIHPLHHGYP